jgi:hypothetical protein
MKSRVVALALAVLFTAGAPALAQTATPSPTASPMPNALPTIPPNAGSVIEGIVQRLAGDATAGLGVDPNHVKGTVTYFRRFDLQLRMPLNVYKVVHLHQGTIINPRGATIESGQTLDVVGHANSDGSVNADAITIVQ